MVRLLKTLIVVLIILIVAFVVIGLMLPTDFLVSRSIIIDAPADRIHSNLNDLNKWPQWSPWVENDPNLKITVGDISSGVGATQSWVSKDGNGSLVFTSSDPAKGINYDVEFNEGQYRCKSNFIYVPNNEGTEVIWEMSGNMDTPVIGGYFAAKMDSWVGREFEKGLSNLKEIVESQNR